MIIAQISDTHILAPSSDQAVGGRRAETLRRCVAAINRQRPDVVVHTGDIVQHGDAEEYAHARAILADLAVPIYLIPGNRDDRDALRAAFGDHAYLPGDGGFLHYAIDDYPVRLLALDSTAAGERKGVYCAERLAWLDDTLARAPDKPTVLFIHHPPFDIGDHYVGGYRRRQDADDLAAVVGRHNQVERLLCGHVHCAVEQPWGGTVATTMPSVAADVRIGNGTAAISDAPLYFVHTMSRDARAASHMQIVTD